MAKHKEASMPAMPERKDLVRVELRKKSLGPVKLDQMVTLTIRGKVKKLSHDEYGFCLEVEPVKVNLGTGGDTE
jgi:hypothetical protein